MEVLILPDRNVPKDFLEDKIDGGLLPSIIGKEVFYSRRKESYTEFGDAIP